MNKPHGLGIARRRRGSRLVLVGVAALVASSGWLAAAVTYALHREAGEPAVATTAPPVSAQIIASSSAMRSTGTVVDGIIPPGGSDAAVSTGGGAAGDVTPPTAEQFLQRVRQASYWQQRRAEKRVKAAALQAGVDPSLRSGLNRAPEAGDVPFSDAWGAEPSTAERISLLSPMRAAAPRQGTFRTVCVRLCDGAYVPMSFATRPENFAADAERCASQCGAPARLFIYPNPGGVPEEMEDLQGRAYVDLPSAFQFRRRHDAACTCGPRTWTLAAQHGSEPEKSAEPSVSAPTMDPPPPAAQKREEVAAAVPLPVASPLRGKGETRRIASSGLSRQASLQDEPRARSRPRPSRRQAFALSMPRPVVVQSVTAYREDRRMTTHDIIRRNMQPFR